MHLDLSEVWSHVCDFGAALSTWYGSQKANNTFTLMGAAATVYVGWVATNLARDNARAKGHIAAQGVVRVLDDRLKQMEQSYLPRRVPGAPGGPGRALDQLFNALMSPIAVTDATLVDIAGAAKNEASELARNLASARSLSEEVTTLHNHHDVRIATDQEALQRLPQLQDRLDELMKSLRERRDALSRLPL